MILDTMQAGQPWLLALLLNASLEGVAKGVAAGLILTVFAG